VFADGSIKIAVPTPCNIGKSLSSRNKFEVWEPAATTKFLNPNFTPSFVNKKFF
jgi:hypothetical protein